MYNMHIIWEVAGRNIAEETIAICILVLWQSIAWEFDYVSFISKDKPVVHQKKTAPPQLAREITPCCVIAIIWSALHYDIKPGYKWIIECHVVG